MKIGIIGCGAMGSVYASFFSSHDFNVSVIDKWKEHTHKISSKGLKITGPKLNKVLKTIKVVKNVKSLKNENLIIIATKIESLDSVCNQLKQIRNSKTPFLFIQNGIGSIPIIKKYFSNFFIGIAEGFGASIIKPGHVHHNSMRQIRIGHLKKNKTKEISTIVKLWEKAGFNANKYEDINQLIWEKFLCNVFLSAPCTAFECTIGDLLNSKQKLSIAKGCLMEAYRLGLKNNINFTFKNPISYGLKFAKLMPKAKPSMYLDFLNRKKSEIDYINGAVVTLSKKKGLSAPYNETLAEIIKTKEKDFA